LLTELPPPPCASEMPLSTNPEAVRSRLRRACASAQARSHEINNRLDVHATVERADEDRRRLRRERERDARSRRLDGLSWAAIYSLRPARIQTPWRSVPCSHCGALLLESEAPTWCCKGGTKVLQRLPPYPP